MVDNPVFIPDDFAASGAHGPGMVDNTKHWSPNQRMSPYFFVRAGSHSSGASHSPPGSLHNFYHAPPPSNYYYHPAPDYPVPPSAMWHRNPRYQEEERPNMTGSHYPRMQVGPNPQVQMPNRRYSLASVNGATFAQPPQRRRISVTKYQNIPPGNYLQVPAFHDYDHNPNYVSSKSSVHHLDVPRDYLDYLGHSTPQTGSKDGAQAAPVHSRKSSATGCIPKSSSSRRSKSLSHEASRSQSPADDRSKTPPRSSRSRSPSLERMNTPDPSTLPVPAFEFTSSHLPLRPPTININKYSSGSGSMSTPESQRIESRQMIRPSSSKAAPYSPKVTVRRESRKDGAGSKFEGASTGHGGDRSIFSITKPAKWCRHADGKTCHNCSAKSDALSVCSSVNPPPTFTALDNYQPVRKRGRCSCTCSAIFSISVMLAVLVMLFITAFILYVEMVLKHQTANVMDKM